MIVPKKSLEDRVTEIEAKLAKLDLASTVPQPDPINGWRKIWGAFADDPAFDEAMKLGREYREAQRPRTKPP